MTDQPQYGFWPFVLPFMAFMLISMLEVKFPSENQDGIFADVVGQASDNVTLSDGEQYVLDERRSKTNQFFWVYSLKVVITTGLLIWFWRVYLRDFPLTASWLAVPVGVLGVVVWILFCDLGLEHRVMSWFIRDELAIRSQFNPFSQLPQGWPLYFFLAIRFFGLAVMVPICEELLLRGFLMRYFEDPEWWTVSLSRLSFRTLLVAPAYGVLTHPTEALAAIAWFSLVTWLVQHTGNFWDAVVAHAVTNFLLGLYVCYYAQWHLW